MTALPAHRPIAGVTERTIRLVRAPAPVPDERLTAAQQEAEQARLEARRERERAARLHKRSKEIREKARALREKVRTESMATKAVEQALRVTMDERDRLRGGQHPIQKCVRKRAQAIIAVVCSYCEIEEADLASRYRTQAVVLARALVAKELRRLTPMSYPEIARAIGKPNHSTVITAHQRIEKQIADCAPVHMDLLALNHLTVPEVVGDIERMIDKRMAEAQKPAA